jgi:hypothetical protein
MESHIKVVAHRRTNGIKETIHFLLYEGVRSQIYIRISLLHLKLGLKWMRNGSTCEQDSSIFGDFPLIFVTDVVL